jgi:hypothetical protein
MVGAVPPRTGVCVIRAWVEGDTSPELRVVITHTSDIAVGDETVAHAGNVPDSLDIVAAWLYGVISSWPDQAEGGR